MFTKLIESWNEYQKVLKEKPYDPVAVQGQGMAFSYHWNKCKEDICNIFDVDPSEFNYSLKHTIMPRVIAYQEANTDTISRLG